ncbi:hypothetical protein LT330_005204 [Penicillium expansum]|nr:hypothetical protein LT330_005204 [Penicillium expansum]
MSLPQYYESSSSDSSQVVRNDDVCPESQCEKPSRQSTMSRLWSVISPATRSDQTNEQGASPILTGKKIEDYPQGRPRFAALIASQDSFKFCRRFPYLRTRLLLEKQDRLSLLEKRLDDIDREETRNLNLSSSRLDRNQKRQDTMKEIDEAMADYADLILFIPDSFIQRSSQILQAPPPESSHVQNLRNWIEGNRQLARHETEYVTEVNMMRELASLAPPADGALNQSKWADASSDPNVFGCSGAFLENLARILITILVIAYLLVPVVICNSFVDISGRLGVIIMSTAVFVITLAGLMRARTVDLFIAGSAYATVLTVFITNTN